MKNTQERSSENASQQPSKYVPPLLQGGRSGQVGVIDGQPLPAHSITNSAAAHSSFLNTPEDAHIYEIPQKDKHHVVKCVSPDGGSIISDSLTEQSASVLTPSTKSASASFEAERDRAQSSQKSYLSPLRSKRYDSLRSSLLPTSTKSVGQLQAHSRSSSMASILRLSEMEDDYTLPKPAEVVKWTKLRKISLQLYGEEGKRRFGQPTCLAVCGTLAIGTSKGLLLIFDYQQSCKYVIGEATLAASAGAISAIAISADHTRVVTGHAHGSVFLWELKTPKAYVIHIDPTVQETTDVQGHRLGTRVTHVSFGASDNSVIVSGDDSGLVFCHTLSQRLLRRTIETIRILGRYPGATSSLKFKPSSIYTIAVLPVGNVTHFTDSIGLVAVLTPYQLVIISTRPSPRTQLKLNRPSGVLAQAEVMSGCAVWFPAYSNRSETHTSVPSKHPVLALAWCQQIMLLEVNEAPTQDISDPIAKAYLQTIIKQVSMHRCRESIVALQWYNEEILCALTKSSTFLILDTMTWSTLGECDLLTRQILHHNIHTNRLLEYFIEREAEYVQQEFADDFSDSLQIYRGKIFILGAMEICVGSFLTWADKLIAFISGGQNIEAIQLLVGYCNGALRVTGSGLPQDVSTRKKTLESKLNDTILSSVRYSLASEDLATRSDAYHTRLLAVCFEARLFLTDETLLLDAIYDVYMDANRTEIFLDCLAVCILDEQMTVVPPSIVQDLIQRFTSQNLTTRLEDIICRLEPSSLDVNHITRLCQAHSLYDALTYVYTEALGDFTTPLMEFLRIIRTILSSTNGSIPTSDADMQMLGTYTVNAVKVFSYISLTLRGKSFPLARSHKRDTADLGRSCILKVLYSDSNIHWPANSEELFTTIQAGAEPIFPYLRLLLHFDVPTLLASMDEAFEDSYFNEGTVELSRGIPEQQLATRQSIVNILLDVMSSDFAQEDIIYLYMFIARNVPKYPQFIVLSGTVLQNIIIGLCQYTDVEIADDCETSVEYLLSVYRPADSANMAVYYDQAGFFRVLKGLYRSEGRWKELLLAYLNDRGDELVTFDYLEEILGLDSMLDSTQRTALEHNVLQNIIRIMKINVVKATDFISRCIPRLQPDVYTALLNLEDILHNYLKRIFETDASGAWITASVRAKYIELLCTYNIAKVLTFVRTLRLEEIDAEAVLQQLEKFEVTDAIVHLMSMQGKRHEALTRVLQRLYTIQDVAGFLEAGQAQLSADSYKTYAEIGCNLCDLETQNHVRTSEVTAATETVKNGIVESMWAELLTAVVDGYAKAVLASKGMTRQLRQIQKYFLPVVQATVSRFLTSLQSHNPTAIGPTVRAWLSSPMANSTSVRPLQPIFKEVFDSYQCYFQMLALINGILDENLYSHVAESGRGRTRGWKVTASLCTVCLKSLQGDFLGKLRFKELQANRRATREEHRAHVRAHVLAADGIIPRNETTIPDSHTNTVVANETRTSKLRGILPEQNSLLISHACGHMTHESCLKDFSMANSDGKYQCPRCLIDYMESSPPVAQSLSVDNVVDEPFQY